MGKEKKKKIKRKKTCIILGILLLVFIVGSVVTYFFYHLDIEKHYYRYAVTWKNTKLYDKNGKDIGTIMFDTPLELEKEDSNQKYFKIKNTDYYVYYKDVKKGKEVTKTSWNDNQVALGKEIKITKTSTFFRENRRTMILRKNTTFSVFYEDKENYYIFFQNMLLKLIKDESIEESKENEEEEVADHISVLFYEDILDQCNSDNTCTTTNDFKSQVTELLNQGYYTITREEFLNYINGYIRLKPKAIFLTTSTSLEILKPVIEELKISIQNINEEEELKYFSTNQTNTVETEKAFINRYQIKSGTPASEIIQLAEGEKREILQDNQGIAVLNYHFFYDGNGGEICDETICLDVHKFREHLNYLKENHFKTLTMSEFKKWMYGEIELPNKSILITVDDGAMGTGTHNGNKLIPLLEEYKMHATLFLITGWWSIDNYRSPYLDIQSHTNDMHQYGSCGRGQINCATYEEAKADLERSLAVVGNNDSFCFPFYMYSSTSLQAVKDVGFQLAFVGGNRKATRSNNKYLIPRYPIQSDITLQYFMQIVN